SAQKSTSTGWRLDSSITSLTNVCLVVSLTTLLGAAASPLCNIVISSVLRPCRPRRPSSPVHLDHLGPFHRALPLAAQASAAAPKTRIWPITWCQRGCLQSITQCRAGASCSATASIRGGWPVASRPHEVRARDRGGHGVDQRVAVDGFMAHQRGVEHHAH